jgi:transposase
MSQQSNCEIAVIGIDIGKNSFHVVGHDRRGAIVLRQKWSRGQVEARLANLTPCLIGMEACVGAHHLSRKLQLLGHNARLMPAKYVRPYSKGQKNDFRDAEAIAEAVQRPTMKFVATKTADQLDLQALHRVRERLVSQRTGVINQIRAFLLERGVAVRQGLRFLRVELPGILATRTDVLSPRMSRVIQELAGDWRHLDARIESLSGEIETLAHQDQHCERLMTVPGIGPIISSAMVAAIGTGEVFSKGRDFGAWLGLVPKQISTGLSSAAYQSAAIAICALSSFRRLGWCWSSSGPSSGSAMGSKLGSRRRRSDCTTTSLLLRWPISLRASRGRFSTRGAPSRASRPMR